VRGQDWTPAPWRVVSTGERPGRDFEEAVIRGEYLRIYVDRREDFGNPLPDARRIVAAINAAKDFTTAGLEEIDARHLTLELALRASMLLGQGVVQTEQVSDQVLAERLAQITDATGITKQQNTNDDDTGEYELSRGD
jgi:hypothetical protein